MIEMIGQNFDLSRCRLQFRSFRKAEDFDCECASKLSGSGKGHCHSGGQAFEQSRSGQRGIAFANGNAIGISSDENGF